MYNLLRFCVNRLKYIEKCWRSLKRSCQLGTLLACAAWTNRVFWKINVTRVGLLVILISTHYLLWFTQLHFRSRGWLYSCRPIIFLNEDKNKNKQLKVKILANRVTILGRIVTYLRFWLNDKVVNNCKRMHVDIVHVIKVVIIKKYI